MVIIHTCAQCDKDSIGNDNALQIDRITKKISRGLILHLSHKAVTELIASRAIIMEGSLMNTVKTFGADGQGTEWHPSTVNHYE
jgi:hypothetical protein